MENGKLMTGYKRQIEGQLHDNNWKVFLINEGEEWWIDEYWTIKSIKHNIDLELFVIFEVDPMFEGIRKKGQGIWNINVASIFPSNRLDKEFSVSSISMIKEKFDIKLSNFLRELNDYRKKRIEEKFFK